MTHKIRRSEINRIIREAEAFFDKFHFVLPPFGRWEPKDFQARKSEIGAIVEAGLGWDITDFGLGDFAGTGLLLFTTRNGRLEELKRGGGMVYAEKAMIAAKDQVTPNHAHVIKTEDIINRGGGTLVIELHGATDGACDRTKGTTVMCDGIARALPPGGRLHLAPGESVTLKPGDWHSFWAEGGDVFVAEVSTVNDDATDNLFEDPAVTRFSGIEEDEAPYRLLVSDYATWLR
ncbi:D-lyxose/D-mannose family sugar isomerase [Rhizobium rhizosphaerae]|uniref:D-lyxose/D-mannose family sugar isomerase n=1 Tax=Xaviernesmea rhizosphaerae TaxID=1672749 RepID=UPI001FDA57DA|nr:D-lyxose/D-mannose family sugar isomerase [Xaviernesmea rhizosphaerae]